MGKMLKKPFLVLVVLMLFTLAACGNNGSEEFRRKVK